MKFLIVEDDLNTANVIKSSLAAYSHTVEISSDGTDGLFLAKSYDYDAILLDNSLPGKDGMSICREIRSAGKTVPILFMSVDDETDTKLQAFRNGADDYMTKPFALEEMRARIEAVTRHAFQPIEVALLEWFCGHVGAPEFAVEGAPELPIVKVA